MHNTEEFNQRLEDCRELYLKHGGQHHELIEKEMRDLGYRDFHRRNLYRRFERGTCKPGWIETYGWNSLLKSVPCAAADGLMQTEAFLSPKGTNNIAQGKDEVRNPGYGVQYDTDPEGVEQLAGDVAPLQGADVAGTYPGVTPASRAHPGLLSLSPSATGETYNDFDEFKDWLMSTWPTMTWEWKHQVYIYKRLKRVWDGACKRLMIFMPPRHGKSELVTVRFPAYILKHRPGTNIIVGSYNQRLANRFSRKIRNALADDWSACNPSPKGTKIIAQGKDEVRNPGYNVPHHSDPEGVEQTPRDVAPLQGAEGVTSYPGVTPASRAHPGGSSSPPLLFPSSPPRPFSPSRPPNSEAEWETPEGGGVRAVGVGAGVTGYGADIIIIDDPVKSRAEAESETFRERVWDWFNDDIYTRLEPDGKIILIQTRWHEDDLAGRLLRESKEEGGEQWEVVNLPALAEVKEKEKRREGEEEMDIDEAFLSLKGTKIIAQGQAEGRNPGYNVPHHSDPEGVEQTPRDVAPLQGAKAVKSYPGVTLAPLTHPGLLSLSPSATGEQQSTDALGRKIGEALCPEWFNEEKLERIKRKLGSYSFSALYQQTPVPAEGGLFKRAWFRIVNSPPPNLQWKRGYDLGISTNAGSDYTASLRVAYDKDENMYIDGAFRQRIEYPDQRRFILGRIEAEPGTEHGIELSANGNAVVQDLRRDQRTRGRPLRGVKVKGDKVTNALPWIALAEEGKVFLIRGHWNQEFLDEAASFPSGTHDDQIDATSIAVKMHREQSGKLYRFNHSGELITN